MTHKIVLDPIGNSLGGGCIIEYDSDEGVFSPYDAEMLRKSRALFRLNRLMKRMSETSTILWMALRKSGYDTTYEVLQDHHLGSSSRVLNECVVMVSEDKCLGYYSWTEDLSPTELAHAQRLGRARIAEGVF